MSRTFKDKPYRLTREPWDKDTLHIPAIQTYTVWKTKEKVEIDTFIHLQLPTTKTKKRKTKDTEDHWGTTPMWWIHMVMSRPKRRAANAATHKALLAEDIEEVDVPDLGRKPHIYFY